MNWRSLKIQERLWVYPVQAELPEAIDRIIASLPVKNRPLKILELGTGSGIIACALAASDAGHQVIATDILYEAARLARKNAQANGLTISTLVCDLTAAIDRNHRFDVVVFNVPNTVVQTPFGNLLQHLGKHLLPKRLLEPVASFLARNAIGQVAAKQHLLDRLLAEVRPRMGENGVIFLLIQSTDIDVLKRTSDHGALAVEVHSLKAAARVRLLKIRFAPPPSAPQIEASTDRPVGCDAAETAASTI